MRSESTTVADYLDSLPDDRKNAISAIRDVIKANLPQGYEEVMNWGMITYQVPLDIYPDTYNGQPLMYAALASQKSHMAVYLTGVYISESAQKEFEQVYRATGKRMDMGKSCVRFKKIDDLPIELIGKTIASVPVTDLVNRVKAVHAVRKSRNK